jgi:hypothetical protein
MTVFDPQIRFQIMKALQYDILGEIDMSGAPVCIVIQHPTEFTVFIWDTPKTWTKIAQFVHETHAQDFAKSIKSYHTRVVKPAHLPQSAFEPGHGLRFREFDKAAWYAWYEGESK